MYCLKNSSFDKILLSKTVPGHCGSQQRLWEKTQSSKYKVKCSKRAKSSVQDSLLKILIIPQTIAKYSRKK